MTAERFGQSFKRFPIAMLLSLFLVCFLIYLNHGGKVGDKMVFFLIFYHATAALLAVATSLLTEDFKRWPLAAAVQLVIHAAWLSISYYLMQFERFSLPQLIAVSATVAAIGLAVFIICFYRRNQDVPFWNFSLRTLGGLAASVAICGALALGLFALVESLKLLFGFQISDKVFGDIASVCMVMLAPILFMNIIPDTGNKYVYNIQEFSRFAKGVVQYLFIPLLGLYMITLYAYGIKILHQWSLPVGGVSYLVTGSMVLMVLLIYLTYPIQHLEGNKVFKRVTRWLPVLMLPLLALMTVAIGRRLSDYGITVSRLYLLVFNIWCYAVCLWLIFTRNKRIWLIPASFAVILFLISVGPQSIANVTQRQLKDEARRAFEAAGATQFPLSAEQYETWAAKVGEETASSIDGKLDYLQDFYRYESVQDLVDKDVVLGRISKMKSKQSDGGGYEYYSNWLMSRTMDVPAGFSHMEWVEMSEDCLDDMKGDLMTIVIKSQNGKEQTFELNVNTLIALDQEKCHDELPEPLVLQNAESRFVVNHFTLSINDSKSVNYLTLDGLLLTK